MAYLAISDVRAEGVTDAVSDALITARISEVEGLMERCTRTWFESREMTFTLTTRLPSQRLRLPYPAIEITTVTEDEEVVPASRFRIEGGTNPRVLYRRDGWARDAEIEVEGKFGTVDADGNCPAFVKAAMVQWVIFILSEKADIDALVERRSATTTARTVSGSSLAFRTANAPWSGHPEVDRVIRLLLRPRAAVAF